MRAIAARAYPLRGSLRGYCSSSSGRTDDDRAQLTRAAIEEHLGAKPGDRRLLAAAAAASGRHDISERIEEIVAAEMASPR